MKHDAVSVTALLVLVAFVIERVTTSALFILSLPQGWRKVLRVDADTEAKRGEAERRYKLYYYSLASALALVLLLLSPGMRVLQALDIQASWMLDMGLTCLILVAGADRIGSFFESKGAHIVEEAPKPLQVEGTLILKEDRERAKSQAAA
jgi:hypothetical protein